jgi:hypothetical protein
MYLVHLFKSQVLRLHEEEIYDDEFERIPEEEDEKDLPGDLLECDRKTVRVISRGMRLCHEIKKSTLTRRC